MTTARRNTSDIIKYGMLAGAAGGLAEVAWVSLYVAVTGGDAAILARGVTTAVGVTALLPAAPVAIGITVHMLLAVVLGVAPAETLRRCAMVAAARVPVRVRAASRTRHPAP